MRLPGLTLATDKQRGQLRSLHPLERVVVAEFGAGAYANQQLALRTIRESGLRFCGVPYDPMLHERKADELCE